jgi:hypothetical protein
VNYDSERPPVELPERPSVRPPARPRLLERLPGLIVGAAAFLLVIRFFPVAFAGRSADEYARGDESRDAYLLHGAGRDLLTLVQPERFYGPGAQKEHRFHTGSSRFNGEWYFGTFAMTVAGAGQTVSEHPALTNDAADILTLGLDTLFAEPTRRYDTEAWHGSDALTSLDRPGEDHCAYLCYLAFSLGLARIAEPRFAHADHHDQIIAALKRKMLAAPSLLLATYPDEFYPLDNAMFIGALGLHAQATGTDHSELLRAWDAAARARFTDPATGLLYQRTTATGQSVDLARGSGTAFASYALSRALPALSRDLWLSIRKHLYTTVLGFGAIREFSEKDRGRGDIDSGPVIFGLGVAASGFAIGAARAHGDIEAFRTLYASAHLMGMPVDGDARRNFVAGGPIGQAILFAMMTAAPITMLPKLKTGPHAFEPALPVSVPAAPSSAEAP